MSTKWLLYGLSDNAEGFPFIFDSEEELKEYLYENADQVTADISFLHVEKVLVQEEYSVRGTFLLDKITGKKK